MPVEKYNVRFRRQLELLWPSLVINSLTIVIYIYIIGVTAPLYITITFFSFFFIVNLLPVLILHVQYLRENKNSLLILNKIEKKLSYQNNGKVFDVDFSDIVSLYYYSSYGRGSWYTFGEYGFCKITLSNNQEIRITCLMMRNVKEKLEEIFSIKAHERIRFLALLPPYIASM